MLTVIVSITVRSIYTVIVKMKEYLYTGYCDNKIYMQC